MTTSTGGVAAGPAAKADRLASAAETVKNERRLNRDMGRDMGFGGWGSRCWLARAECPKQPSEANTMVKQSSRLNAWRVVSSIDLLSHGLFGKPAPARWVKAQGHAFPGHALGEPNRGARCVRSQPKKTR
jgi:hypothetical protein